MHFELNRFSNGELAKLAHVLAEVEKQVNSALQLLDEAEVVLHAADHPLHSGHLGTLLQTNVTRLHTVCPKLITKTVYTQSNES